MAETPTATISFKDGKTIGVERAGACDYVGSSDNEKCNSSLEPMTERLGLFLCTQNPRRGGKTLPEAESHWN